MFGVKNNNLDKLVLEVTAEFEQSAKLALSTAVNKGIAFSKAKASEAYKSKYPLDQWNRGFGLEHKSSDLAGGVAVNKVTSDTYIISLTGKMADLFDEGKTSDLPKIIMNGKVASKNKQLNKDYVDVPLSSKSIQKKISTGITATAYRSADELVQAFTRTKMSGTPLQKLAKQKQLIKNVKNIAIDNERQRERALKDAMSVNNSKFVVIKRINQNSKWDDYSKAPRIFSSRKREVLDVIEREFYSALRKLI